MLNIEDKNASAIPPADLAIWRPGSTGVWYVRITGASWVTQNWGTTDDIPVAGDYDGDGTTDFSVFRPSDQKWYVIHSSDSSMHNYQFGNSTDVPAAADYDGDGKTDEAVFRPSNYTWYIHASTVGYYTQAFGAADDIPAPADHDGDGKADLAVFRPSTRTFYSFATAVPGMNVVASGISSGDYTWCDECLVSSDYDGDGKADYAVFDKLAANWYIKPSSGTMSNIGTPSSTTSEGFGVFQWGASGDRPVPNDYDTAAGGGNDGKTDIATWRNSNGNWYIRVSSDSYSLRQVGWGQSGDIPVPAFFRR